MLTLLAVLVTLCFLTALALLVLYWGIKDGWFDVNDSGDRE